MLGLTIWTLNLFYLGYDLVAAVAFVLSLGFKQMALYYAPAVGCYLLGKCLYLGWPKGYAHVPPFSLQANADICAPIVAHYSLA